MKIIIAAILFCFPLLADPMGLAELIDLGLKNNPETAKAWAATKRSEAQLGAARSDYYPAIGIQGKLSQGRDVKYVNGPEVIFTNYGADLVLSYLLYDFGERKAAVQATREALKAARWSEDFSMQKIIYKVSASYYEYLNVLELVQTKENIFKDAMQLHDSVDELHKAGLRSESDQSLSKATVAQMQMELPGWRAKVTSAYGKLLIALGVPLESQIEIKTTFQECALSSEGIQQLISKAEEMRADVLAKKALLSEKHER
ncbi:MAG TPA: TolC family protein, partial [Rhabdochlamydiaceae bacterium]